MGVSFVKPATAVTAVTETKVKRKPMKAVEPPVSLDQPGILRICHLMAVMGGLSRASIYARIVDKRLPAPDGHDGRPYWRTESVKTYLESQYGSQS